MEAGERLSVRARRALASANEMVARSAEVLRHLERVPPGRLATLVRQVRISLECLHDVVRGRYHLPWRTVASLAVALGYFVAPIDVVPDFVPFSGFVDDAGVLGFVFMTAQEDLRRYCEWRGIRLG